MFLAYIASLAWPHRLSDDRAHNIVHDGDSTTPIMSVNPTITTLDEVLLQVSSQVSIEKDGSQYKFYVVREGETSANRLNSVNNGVTTFTPNSPGTYWIGTIGASHYGSNIVVYRQRITVEQTLAPTLSPSSAPTCSYESDIVLIGSGAGGCAAAAVLQERGVDFLWFEAGQDESDLLDSYPAVDPRSVPTMSHSPTDLYFGSEPVSYSIPLGAGGMTSHYSGNMYWTREDLIESLSLTPSEEEEALSFVLRHLRVHCGEEETAYHSHGRSPLVAAPFPEGNGTSLPSCFYGHCKSETGEECDLNRFYMMYIDGNTTRVSGWHRDSAFVEFGGTPLFQHRATSLRTDGQKVTGVYFERPGGNTVLACARKVVLLAAGVMGNAPIILQSLPENDVSQLSFFAQPLVVYRDTNTTDCTSFGGGTLHRQHRNGTGFLSTFAACVTDRGETRLLWATPQAVNPEVTGRLSLVEGRTNATLTLPDSVIDSLRSDFSESVASLFGAEISLDGTFDTPSYHWTGSSDNVHRSRLRKFDNLFVGDAMGVIGATSGWTSFNTRVAGTVGALRALQYVVDPCHSTERDYREARCCVSQEHSVCDELRAAHESLACCEGR